MTLHLAKLRYVTNVYTNFEKNYSKTIGGVHDTKLLIFCIQTDKQTHRQTDRQVDSSIPPKTFI